MIRVAVCMMNRDPYTSEEITTDFGNVTAHTEKLVLNRFGGCAVCCGWGLSGSAE